jgi:acyl-[acyl carrier protein]--UDP-N-acetylglucosamine O-acyltransferase
MLTQDDVLRKIRERDSEIRELTNQLESVNLDFLKREKIFNTTKTYMEELYKQIYEKKNEN